MTRIAILGFDEAGSAFAAALAVAEARVFSYDRLWDSGDPATLDRRRAAHPEFARRPAAMEAAGDSLLRRITEERDA